MGQTWVVVLDNDGVNIDSEDVAMRVMDDWGVAFVRRYRPDADLPKDYIYTTYPGTSTNKIVEKLIEKFDLSVPQIAQDYSIISDGKLVTGNSTPEQKAALLEEVGLHLADLITIETNNRFRIELTSVPGTTQALTELRGTFGRDNIILMTTSREDRMDVSLAHAKDPETGENARLDEFYPKGPRRRSGYGHSNKYDEGFAALGLDPKYAIIVEDSLSGVTKAKAGRDETNVIGTVAARFYTDKKAQATALLDAGATIVVSDMRDLPAAAKWIKDGKPETLPAFKSRVFFPGAMPLAPGASTAATPFPQPIA